MCSKLIGVARATILAFGGIVNVEVHAAETQQPAQTVAADPGWPRQYSDNSGKLLVYQPQVDSWTSFRRLEARFAVALTPAGSRQPVYGAVRVASNTEVDTASRTVALTDFAIVDIRYSSALADTETKRLQALTTTLFPKPGTSVSLDRILAYMDTSKIKARNTAVSLDPPPILVSTQPAILVIVDGEPAFVGIDNTNLQKVVNTNWDLFLETKDQRFYLRNGKSWLSARELTGAWRNETKLPDDFRRLPETDEYKEVKQTVASPQKAETVTLVIAVNKPSELIVINGSPVQVMVPGTELSWVSNTECDLFFAAGDRNYYFLTSGRWFRTADLRGGKWESATNSLPADFKKIPIDHPRAHVLASVPGTRQAEDAVLMASIPQTASIDRKTAQAKVEYVGEPKFEAIAGTNVSYATNTPSDVLRVGDSYYLCLDGVWFVSTSPTGMWSLADKIPDEIYQLPPDSPKHHVTYVTVYESTPETVVYGYTPGYTGVYVSYGVAMWGTGYYYPPYYGWGYYPYPVYWPYGYYTYGASAWYNPATGAYARGSAVYGPFGGYGRAAAYSPSTGRYSWGQAAWGPYGAAASGGFYNPNTGRWGGRATASNGYQSWGSSVVGGGGQRARTASYSDSRGTIGAIKGSGGGAAIAARGNQGQGFVGRSGAGDVYAGRDGNVYKRDQSGQWSKHNDGSWESIERSQGASGIQQRPTRDQISNAAQGRGVSGGSTRTSQPVEALNRDAAARSWGNYNSQRATSARSTGSYSGGAHYRGFAGRGGRRR